MEGSTHNDEVDGDKEETRKSKSTPSESAEQESSGNAGEREARDQDSVTGSEDQDIADECGFPSGRRRLDQFENLGHSCLDIGRVGHGGEVTTVGGFSRVRVQN